MPLRPKAKVEARGEGRGSAQKPLLEREDTLCCGSDDLGTEWAFEDIITVVEGAHQHLDVIMIPK